MRPIPASIMVRAVDLRPKKPALFSGDLIGSEAVKQFEARNKLLTHMKLNDLRKSCGVKPSGNDRIQFRHIKP